MVAETRNPSNSIEFSSGFLVVEGFVSQLFFLGPATNQLAKRGTILGGVCMSEMKGSDTVDMSHSPKLRVESIFKNG